MEPDQQTKGRPCKSWQELVQVIICDLNLFIVFSMLYIISTTIDYIYQLCFLYVKLSSHLLTLREREQQ